MKKVIPAIIAVILIILIGGVAFGRQLWEKYSYSDEQADLHEYFHIMKEEEVAMLLQDEIVEEKAVLADGVCYFDLDTVHTYFNSRFYVDRAEGLVLYTTPTSIIRTAIGSNVYDVDGQEINAGYRLTFSRVSGEDTIYYIAADYVKQYTNFSYELFEEPGRMQVYTQWGEQELADVKKDNAVRLLGGVKSPILTKVSKGDTVVVLERMETWCKVKTRDGYIGYIENKVLENERTQAQSPVTDYAEPEYTSLTREHRIALGWHAIYSRAGNDTLSEVTAGAHGMNVISPTWFSLSDNEGHFQSFAAKSYVDRAHGMGLEVWGAVDNFNYRNNNSADVDTQTVLSSLTNRTTLINGLIEAALECGMDGINVDFEQIGSSYGEDYVQFLRELSIQCRLNGLVLSVDDPVPYHYNAHYNIEEQGVVADYVIIMGYDEHGGNSKEAGSVASIGYVTHGLETATAAAPSRKVINALPFYTRMWKTEGTEVSSRAYGMRAVSGLLAEYGMTPEWDEETGQNYASAEKGGAFYQIWVEDSQSIMAKLNVMRMYDLGGVAAWRLGFESSDIWDVVSAYTLE